MFENEWFPKANSMGVSWQEFWGMNPRIIKLLVKGHEEKIKERMKEQDYLAWILGQYFASALDATVCNAFLWRKKGEKAHQYVDKPVLQNIEQKKEKIDNTPLTEEEKKKQQEIIWMSCQNQTTREKGFC